MRAFAAMSLLKQVLSLYAKHAMTGWKLIMKFTRGKQNVLKTELLITRLVHFGSGKTLKYKLCCIQ
jgi:hypothetical protein